MKRLVYIAPMALFLLLAVFFAVGLTKDPRIIPPVIINQPVPEFALPPIKGFAKGLASANLKGAVSLVNIFGSWCVACRVEHPFLMKLKRLDLVPVHGIDWRETDADAGPKWLAKFGNPYTLIGDDPQSKGAIAFGVTRAPETFLIDKQGVIRFKKIGPMTKRDWEQTIWPLIQELRRQ